MIKNLAVELEKPAHQISSVENDFFEKYPYLKTVQKWLPKESTDVDLLIGCDYADLMAPTGYLHHPTDPEKYPTAVETRLGWYMYGPSNSSIATCDEVVNVHRVKFQENVLISLTFVASNQPDYVLARTKKLSNHNF